MTTIVIGLIVNLLTWLGKKFKISGTNLSIWLSFFLWIIYFYFIEFNPAWLDILFYYLTWIYWTTQIVYNVWIKVWIFSKSK
jgi:hypothetical protein